jgi:hypothetical protein
MRTPQAEQVLAERLVTLVTCLAGRVPPQRLDFIEELANVGEPELAVEAIAELELTKEERAELDDLARLFDVDLDALARSRRIAQYDFVKEPRGEKLRGLIAAGAAWCDRFTFELSGMELDDRAKTVIAALEPFLLSCVETTRTPGSISLNPVTLCTYRLTYEPARILADASDRLYDWVEPQLPQDLCFLHGNQRWLITLAADRAASLFVTPGEAAAMEAGGLKLRRAFA